MTSSAKILDARTSTESIAGAGKRLGAANFSPREIDVMLYVTENWLLF